MADVKNNDSDVELGKYSAAATSEKNVAKATDTTNDDTTTPPTPSVTKLLGLSRPEWPSLGFALLLMTGGEVSGLYAPLILSDCYNVVVDPTKTAEEVKSVVSSKMLLVFVLHWAGIGALAIRGMIIAVAGERVVARLRNRLYAHLLSMEISFFDKKKSGDLVSRLGSDTALIQQATCSSFPEVFIGAVKIIATLVLMLVISQKLSVVMFIVFFILLVLCVPFGGYLGRVTRLYQDALAVAATYSTEALGSMRTVRSFVAEGKEAERYQKQIGNPDNRHHKLWWPGAREKATTYRFGTVKGIVAANFGAFAFGMAISALYATLWVGFYDVVDQKLSLGKMVAFQSYVFQMAIGLATLSGHFVALTSATGPAARIFELLEKKAEIKMEGGIVPGKMKGDIVFEDVTFSYPTRQDTPVLKGFNLTVKEHDTVAIVGGSGAGKSTIIALMQRFYDVDSGSLKINGADVRTLNQGWLRSNMGLVAQEPSLFGLTIYENLCYGIGKDGIGKDVKVAKEDVIAAAKRANCHEFIEKFPEGYDTLVGEKGVRLSGGQKQRIAIARALLKDPRVLLLDEATSALDAESEHLVQVAIDDVMVGRTVVVIAHRLSTVRKAAKIVVLHEGNVADEGTHKDLMKNCQIYADLVKRQLSAS